MAATRRPDLSKKSDDEVFDLLGFHISEALKRLTRNASIAAIVSNTFNEDGIITKVPSEEDVEVDTTPMVDDAMDEPKSKPTKKTAPLKKLIEEEDAEGDEFDPFADPGEEEEPEKELTSEDVRLALRDYAALNSKEGAMDIMRKVGKAESVPKIEPKLYGKVIAAAKIKRPKK